MDDRAIIQRVLATKIMIDPRDIIDTDTRHGPCQMADRDKLEETRAAIGRVAWIHKDGRVLVSANKRTIDKIREEIQGRSKYAHVMLGHLSWHPVKCDTLREAFISRNADIRWTRRKIPLARVLACVNGATSHSAFYEDTTSIVHPDLHSKDRALRTEQERLTPNSTPMLLSSPEKEDIIHHICENSTCLNARHMAAISQRKHGRLHIYLRKAQKV